MDKNEYSELIERFWTDKLTEPEKIRLFQFLHGHEEILKSESQKEFEIFCHSKMLDKGEAQAIRKSLVRQLLPQQKKKLPFSVAMKWAAVWIPCILIGSIYFLNKISSQNTLQVSELKIRKPISSVDSLIRAGSSVKNILLSDDISVRLYPNSSITFHQVPGRQRPDCVYLTGDAFFKVRHNCQQPFSVIAGNLKTTDLGTEFLIRSSNRNELKILLKKGKIMVTPTAGSGIKMRRQILSSHESLLFNVKTQLYVLNKSTLNHDLHGIRKADKLRNIEKTPESLCFKGTPLPVVFKRICDYYHYSVQLSADKDNLNTLTFTGSIRTKEGIDVALNLICELNDLSYQKATNCITILHRK